MWFVAIYGARESQEGERHGGHEGKRKENQKEDKRFRSRAPGHSGTEFPTDRRMGPDKMCRNSPVDPAANANMHGISQLEHMHTEADKAVSKY